MPYTFRPSHGHARSYGANIRISTKDAVKICDVIRNKPLKRAKRLLDDLRTGRRNLEGKYYSKAVRHIGELLESCEKNADFLGLDKEKLMIHASAHKGFTLRRRRRRAAFGSRLKSTNIEIMLIERGKGAAKKEVKKQKVTVEREKQVPKKVMEKKPASKEEVSKEEKQVPKKVMEKKPASKEEVSKEEKQSVPVTNKGVEKKPVPSKK